MKRLLWVALLCLLPGLAAAAEPARGEPAPAQLGEARKGEAVDLAEHRGKVVVVTFWASWCGPCRRELPVLDALQKQAGDQWLRIIAVNVQDSAADYRAMMRQMRDFSLLQARDRSGKIAATYGVKAYPNLWIIDPQGRIASHHVGYGDNSFEEIVAEIKHVLIEEIERQKAATAG